MNKKKLEKFNIQILEQYNTFRLEGSIDCVMPGHFSGNDILFVAQNPGQLKEGVEGDELYLRAYERKEYDKLNGYYIKALKSTRGTYGIFINDVYDDDWSEISFTNVYKCPFVDNKLPDKIPELEMKVLYKQIRLLDPKIIISVGSVSRKALILMTSDYKDRLYYCEHPSYLRRCGRYDKEVEKYKKELAELLK